MQSLDELPLKPFFFAQLDLIEHLLAWREEEQALDSSALVSSNNSLR